MAGKRGNGEGSVRKRPDGRWEARIAFERDGHAVRRSVYADTRDEAARLLRAAIKAQEEGLPIPDGRQTVGAYLTDWLNGSKSNLRPQTWRGYERDLRLHVIPFVGRLRLAQMLPADLHRLYQARVDAGLSPTTVRHVHEILSKALGQAARWGLITRNPAGLVQPPRRAYYEMQTLDREQTRALLEAARGDRLQALYVLAVTAGMRQGELLALRWRDVDLDMGRLRVTGTLDWPRGATPTISDPKTARSRRQIQLAASALAALRQHRSRQASERLATEGWGDPLGLVFTNELGRPVDASNLRRAFSKLLMKAGLPPIRFHDLRHTAATLLLSRGVHPKIASEMLGHATVAFTLDVYSHVTETMQQEAANAMDAILTDGISHDGVNSTRVGVNVGVKEQTRHKVDTPIIPDPNTKPRWAGQDSNLGP
ncbi:MAG: site-specific integrase, partial [Candidatus Dormibacteraeota bacterium]|nr:site-specific integrase [Candidatus Dormibacteraeota bacterium]